MTTAEKRSLANWIGTRIEEKHGEMPSGTIVRTLGFVRLRKINKVWMFA